MIRVTQPINDGRKNMDKPKRILIIRTDRLGDVILSTPVIKNLRAAYPKAHIAFMCRPYTKPVLEGNPYLDEVIVYDKYGKHKSIWASVQFSLYLRKKKFDWAIILHPTNRAHFIAFLAGIPYRVGWDRKMSYFLTKKIPHTKQEGKKHELEYTLDILNQIGVPVFDFNTYFPVNEYAIKKVEELFKKLGLGEGEKIIVIHPSASCPSKRWPEEYFSQLIKLISDKGNLKIIIVTSENEKKFGQKIVDENEVIDLRGKLNIAELGALLRKSSLFISNDSGPVHIAAALEIPVISIFGRCDPGLSPRRWRPLGKKSFYFHRNIGCKKCFAHNCLKEFLCLKAISPQEVAKKAISILNLERDSQG